MTARRKGSRRARLREAEDRIESCFRVLALLASELEGAAIRLPEPERHLLREVLAGRTRPRFSARARWSDLWWTIRGEVTHYACYWFLGNVVLAHLAPARMRRAAWADGFACALGGAQARALKWMREHLAGYEAGVEVRFARYPDGELPPGTPRPGAITDEDGRTWLP